MVLPFVKPILMANLVSKSGEPFEVRFYKNLPWLVLFLGLNIDRIGIYVQRTVLMPAFKQVIYALSILQYFFFYCKPFYGFADHECS